LACHVQQARSQAAFMWVTAMGTVSGEAQALFEAAMDEYAFNYAIKAVNSDANHPRVVQNFMPRHTWFGREINGARLGGDNPDNGYRLIPVEHGAAYELLKLKDVPRVLRKGAPTVTAVERRKQLEDRKAAFMNRCSLRGRAIHAMRRGRRQIDI